MSTGQNTFEAIGIGILPTAANSGGTSGTAIAYSSVASGDSIYTSAIASTHGSTGITMNFAGPGTGATRLVWTVTAETERIVLSTYYMVTSLPSSYEDIMGMRSASANVCVLSIGADGKMVMNGAANAGIIPSIATNTIPVGEVIRVEISAKRGTTTTNGTLGYAYYLGDAELPEFTWESTTENAGTADITTLFIGRSTGRAQARTAYYDTVRWNTQATGWLTPFTSAPPATTTGVSLAIPNPLRPGKLQNLTASVTDPNNVVSSVTITQTAGTTVTIFGNGNFKQYIAPVSLTGTTLTFQAVAKNSSGTTVASTTVDHIIPGATEKLVTSLSLVPAYFRQGPPITIPAEPTDPTTQPTGTDYVTIQSLGLASNTDLRGALAKNLGGKILSLPTGIFEAADFSGGNDGVFNVLSTCAGIAGSGRGTIIRIKPGTSTKAGIVSAYVDGNTNPFHTIQAIGGNKLTFRNFAMIGNAGHLHGACRMRTNLNPALVEDVYLYDAAPGNSQTPPGETFGFNLWHCEGGSIVRRYEADGVGTGSSLLGYNDSYDIYIEDAYIHAGKYGMPTFWQCRNVETHNLRSEGGYAGINHERTYGRIRHYNPTLSMDQVRRPNALHIILHNDLQDMPDVEIHDAVPSKGIRNGNLTVLISDVYRTGQKVVTMPKVYRTATNGSKVLMKMVDANNSGGAVYGAADQWWRFH